MIILLLIYRAIDRYHICIDSLTKFSKKNILSKSSQVSIKK